ncbi:hornerin-like [Agrilus planipennis]|uniref:Hornerin-like n=1 Tax=Agrilus planipennis TaxID=224129 RepID=A0A1W4WXA0_AGRPL|nr:hornerin-like [Agrilus planipennis]
MYVCVANSKMWFLFLLFFSTASSNAIMQTKGYVKRTTLEDSVSSSSGYKYDVAEGPGQQNGQFGAPIINYRYLPKYTPYQSELTESSYVPTRKCYGVGCSSFSDETSDFGNVKYEGSTYTSSNGNGDSGKSGSTYSNAAVGYKDNSDDNAKEWKDYSQKGSNQGPVTYSGGSIIHPAHEKAHSAPVASVSSPNQNKSPQSNNPQETRTYQVADNDGSHDALNYDFAGAEFKGRPSFGMYPYLDTGEMPFDFDEGFGDKIHFPQNGQPDKYPPHPGLYPHYPYGGNGGGGGGTGIASGNGGGGGGSAGGGEQPAGLYPYARKGEVGHVYAYGNYPYYFVNNDGHIYKAEEQNKGGKKGETKYKSVHGYDKGEKGSHATDTSKDFFNHKGGNKKGSYSSSDFGGNKFEETKNYEGGKAHENKGHSKGTKVTGYHKVFDKDEFKKDNTFYDEADERGHFKKFGKNYGHHGASEGAQTNGGKLVSGYQEKGGGEKKAFNKDQYSEKDQGFTGKKGEDAYHDNHAGFKGEQEKKNGKTFEFGGQSGQSSGIAGGGQGGGSFI